MNPKFKRLLATAAVMLIAIPTLGFFMGGIYSVPALKLSKEKEPWFSLLCALGLGLTTAVIGLPGGHVPLPWLAGLWACSALLLLLVLRLFKSPNNVLENFGVVHILTVLMVLGVVSVRLAQQKRHDASLKINRPALHADPAVHP